MNPPDCAYCTSPAIGIDDDGEFTCGASNCAPVAEPLPTYIPISDDGDSDDEEETEG